MCRFVLYHGPSLRISELVTEPENSLIHQSHDSRERAEPLNGDGFGLAWYVPGETAPARFRSLTPAWSNENLRHLAAHVHSPLILAHVRAASTGSLVSEANTHPFCARGLALVHNGQIGGFRRARRRLLATLDDETFDLIEGTTDSEALFALTLQHLRAHTGEVSAETLLRALEAAFRQVLAVVAELPSATPSYLNVALTDGRRAVATRFASGSPDAAVSLHLHHGRMYACVDGVGGMRPADERGHAVIVSSEPLCGDPGWVSIPPGHAVLLHEDRSVDVRPLEV